MGQNTLNSYFYKLFYGDKGKDKATLVNDCLDTADAEIKANKDKKHTQGTDQGLDTGGASAVVVTDVKDAVNKKHTQNTDTDLDANFEATLAKKADKLSVFAATTSAELAGVISDETGSGKIVLGTEPTIINPKIVTSINNQTGTTYTFVLTDASKLITFGNADAITVTIPTNADVAFPIGTQIDCIQILAGKVTFGGANVTINSKGGNKSIAAQWVGVTLIKTNTDVWSLVGDLIV